MADTQINGIVRDEDGRLWVATTRGLFTEIDGRFVTEAAIAGDHVATQVFHRIGRHLGVALASYANIFEPELIVIGASAAMPACSTLLATSSETISREVGRAMASTLAVTRAYARIERDAVGSYDLTIEPIGDGAAPPVVDVDSISAATLVRQKSDRVFA